MYLEESTTEEINQGEYWDVAPDFAISQAQADFLDDDTNRYPAYVSGFGGGKTYAGLYKGLDLSVVNRGCPILMLEPTHKMIERIMWPTLFDDILDKQGIPYKFNKTSKTVKLPWGSEIWFDSTENPQRLVGTRVGSAYTDEVGLTPEIAWKNVDSRVRDVRARVFQNYATMTPDNPGWTHDRWGKTELYGEPLPEGYKLYQGRTSDNWTLPGYEDRLLGEWDEDEAEAKVLGKFSFTKKGRIYYTFQAKSNISSKAEYDPNLPLDITFDFNLSPGMHVELCQSRRDLGKYYIIDEVYSKGLNLEKACELILRKYASKQNCPVRVFGDANGRHLASKKSYYHIIKDIFTNGVSKQIPFSRLTSVKAPLKNPSVADSVAAVRSLLKNGKGESLLIVNPACKRLINDLHNVRTSASAAEELGRGYRGDPDEIFKGDSSLTHASDALRYWVYQVRPVRDHFKRQLDYKISSVKQMAKGIRN